MNGDSKSTNERGPSLVGPRAITRDFYPALVFLVSSVQNMFLLTVHHFSLCVPLGPHRPATWAGSRAGPPVSEYVSAVETDMVGLFTTKTVPTTYTQ